MSVFNFLLGTKEEFYPESNYPKVSIILPTFNNAHTIRTTLNSLLMQHYPSFEILVIDAGSKDRTLEIVKSYRTKLIRIFAVSSYNRYEMLNKGISLSKGTYINFVFPGDYYISKENLHIMMGLAIRESFPDLVYCGCLIRDGKSEAKLLYRPLLLSVLKNGQQPTNLQSCWFKASLFRQIGKFDTGLQLRGGFDLFCRVIRQGRMVQFSSINRILLDYDLQGVTREMIVQHFKETLKILLHHFGIKAAIMWLFHQKDTKRYLKSWWKSARIAFLGRS
ncbi:MAG: glycosyltransferase [Parachlamydiaceae bacterium]